MVVCSRCGAANAANAVTCAACGETLAGAPAVGMTPPPLAMAPVPQAARGPRPTGVTILGVLYYVGAGLAVFGAIAVLIVFTAGTAIVQEFGGEPWSGLVAGIGVLAALFVLVFAVLYGAMGWGTMNGKSWAWVVSLILAGLGILGSLGNLASMPALMADEPSMGTFILLWGLVWAAAWGAVVWYLFRPHVKAWFGQ